jgi:hypothetical protein
LVRAKKSIALFGICCAWFAALLASGERQPAALKEGVVETSMTT